MQINTCNLKQGTEIIRKYVAKIEDRILFVQS